MFLKRLTGAVLENYLSSIQFYAIQSCFAVRNVA